MGMIPHTKQVNKSMPVPN